MKTNQTADDIKDDLERLDYGDMEITSKFESLRKSYKAKGLPYRELLKSKFFGTVKYLLVELNDEFGTVLITNLDSNATYSFCDAVQSRQKLNRIKDWAAKR